MMPHKKTIHYIDGVWNLAQYDLIDKQGNSKPLWDSKIRGRLIYLNGYVSVVITKQDSEITIKETICYSGSYEVSAEEIKHTIYTSTVPRYIDAVESRKLFLKEDQLILIHDSHPSGIIHKVTWQKIS